MGRKTKTYHHGNLKHDLIEAGIRLLNEGDTSTISLRAVAAECNVSHTAPYHHFPDKDALIQAIDDYVTQCLLTVLQNAVDTSKYRHERLFNLGCAYVRFFQENPKYYSLLFFRKGEAPRLVMRENALESDFSPFLLFRETAQSALEAVDVPPAMYTERILEMWAMLQGVAALFVLEGFECPNGEETLRMLLRGKLHIKRTGERA